jgi:CheY-like chemotaxis protein
MDYEMPVMNGIEATESLIEFWSMFAIKPVPIVIITAYCNEKEKCLSVGATDFVRKPISINDITRILTDYQLLN